MADEVFDREAARAINFGACHTFAGIVRTNIGPFGSLKMFDDGAGEMFLTKDGGELVRGLSIRHATALFLSRAALAQEKALGDGVSSLVQLIDGILEQAAHKIEDGVHPRIIVRGLEDARDAAIKALNELAIEASNSRAEMRDYVASAALTKSPFPVADVVVDAVQCVREESRVDLDRIEIVRIRSTRESVRLVRGLVLDQGFRHELMPKKMEKVRILAMSESLEMEDTAVNTYMQVADEDQKERMTIAQRKFVDNKLRKIIELKSAVGGDFLLVNARGIDGPSMDILARANIAAVRRVSKKTLMRLVHACNCKIVNCVDDLTPNVLGYAEKVMEEEHRNAKYVFIDEVKDPKAVAIVVAGMTDITCGLIEGAVRDGMRALRHAVEDKKVLPGAGATEVALHLKLMNETLKEVEPKHRFGVQVFAEALLSIPRALVTNCGHDAFLVIPDMLSEAEGGELAGVDAETGEVIDPTVFGIYDNYCVIRGIIQSAPLVASQLLLVDEILTSTREIKKQSSKEK